MAAEKSPAVKALRVAARHQSVVYPSGILALLPSAHFDLFLAFEDIQTLTLGAIQGIEFSQAGVMPLPLAPIG